MCFSTVSLPLEGRMLMMVWSQFMKYIDLEFPPLLSFYLSHYVISCCILHGDLFEFTIEIFNNHRGFHFYLSSRKKGTVLDTAADIWNFVWKISVRINTNHCSQSRGSLAVESQMVILWEIDSSHNRHSNLQFRPKRLVWIEATA